MTHLNTMVSLSKKAGILYSIYTSCFSFSNSANSRSVVLVSQCMRLTCLRDLVHLFVSQQTYFAFSSSNGNYFQLRKRFCTSH